MVAGRVPHGLGAAVRASSTVSVEETRAPGLSDHVVVDASHSGLLLSRHAAALVVHFLEHGRFGPPAGDGGD